MVQRQRPEMPSSVISHVDRNWKPSFSKLKPKIWRRVEMFALTASAGMSCSLHSYFTT